MSELSSGWTGLEPRFNKTEKYAVNPDKKKYLSSENRNTSFFFPTVKVNPRRWVEMVRGVTEGVVKSCQQRLGFRTPLLFEWRGEDEEWITGGCFNKRPIENSAFVLEQNGKIGFW